MSAEDLANGTDSPPPTTTSENCHFHAGVEDCDGDQQTVTDPAIQCVMSEQDYNKKLRIGTIFIVLVTSSIGKSSYLHRLTYSRMKVLNWCGFSCLWTNSAVENNKPKVRWLGLYYHQTIRYWCHHRNRLHSCGFLLFHHDSGTSLTNVLSQLLTHAQILFANPCIGELGYEATATAISMAGIFAAFLIEYVGDRVLQIRAKNKQTITTVGLEASEAVVGKEDTGSNRSEPHVHNHVHTHSHGAHSHGPVVNDKLAVLVMEAGIIFHSIRKFYCFLYLHWGF